MLVCCGLRCICPFSIVLALRAVLVPPPPIMKLPGYTVTWGHGQSYWFHLPNVRHGPDLPSQSYVCCGQRWHLAQRRVQLELS